MCTAPVIPYGTVNPSGAIASGGQTFVTCNPGYKISGDTKMLCSKGKFDNTPKCEGMYFVRNWIS